jgi:PAP2 superfamily
MSRQRTLKAMLACACLISAGPARADVVVDWNVFAAQAIGAAARPGPSGAFDFAMVHAAMHDAVQAIEGRLQPYCGAIPNAAGSPIAAAATAAHEVLVSLFPTQTGTLNATYDSYLADLGLTGDPGVLVGLEAAVCILNLRVGDGRFPANTEVFLGGTGLGEWRPTSFLPGTPPVPVPMVAPWIATVTPFTLKDPAQFRASPPPPHLTSGKYVKDYNEVKALGSLNNSARSPEQTDIAYFFADNSILLWTRVLRTVTDTYLSNIGDSARLFALSYLAMADAYITSWDSKRHWNFWRPVTAIQEGDNDGNPRTAGDPDWQSLITTPSYPDYTSGANCNSGALTTMLANFFGTDKVTFSMTSNTPQVIQKTRTYSRFSDAAEDVVDARVYAGIHFRFADIVARRQGSHVANWAFSHFLRPVSE